MKKFLVFLIGAAAAMAVVGAAAWWFMLGFPSSQLPKAATPVAAPAGIPPASALQIPAEAQKVAPPSGGGLAPVRATGDEKIILTGSVLIPAELRKLLEAKPDAVITYMVGVNNTFARRKVAADLPVSAKPITFNLEPAPEQLAGAAKTETMFISLFAVICFDRNGKSCDPALRPQLSGTMKFEAVSPGGFRKGERVALPPLVINHVFRPADPKACADSVSSISGTIKPVAGTAPGARFAVIGEAMTISRAPYPYNLGNEPVHSLTHAEIAAMGKFGLAAQVVELKGGEGPFSLSLPAGFQEFGYRLFARPCANDEVPEVCLARAFPLDVIRHPSLTMTGTARDNGQVHAYPLYPRGFEVPVCGTKGQVFYYRPLKIDVPFATEATVRAANPPEVIEGTVP